MSDRFLSTSKGPAFCKYATSKGQSLFERGYWNPMPVDTYLSGDGLSHTYRGSGYYVPSERSWIDYKDYRSLPPLTRRDAIHMDSEEKYRAFQRRRDARPNPSGNLLLLIIQLLYLKAFTNTCNMAAESDLHTDEKKKNPHIL